MTKIKTLDNGATEINMDGGCVVRYHNDISIPLIDALFKIVNHIKYFNGIWNTLRGYCNKYDISYQPIYGIYTNNLVPYQLLILLFEVINLSHDKGIIKIPTYRKYMRKYILFLPKCKTKYILTEGNIKWKYNFIKRLSSVNAELLHIKERRQHHDNVASS